MQNRHAMGVAALLVAAILGAGCQLPHRPRVMVEAPGSAYQKLFNKGWLFKLEDAAGAEAPGFADGGWRKLDLPHDWSIEQPFDEKWASGTGFLPGGIAWYRKHFTVPAEKYAKVYTVRFDGVYKNSTVYLNGHKLGDRPYGYSSFEYDLTPYLNKGGDNVIAVRVDHHDFADSRWYPGSGIYRNVYLTATSPIHFDKYGVYATTPEITKESATIALEYTLRNTGGDAMPVTLATRILDPQGKVVGTAKTEVVVGQNGRVDPSSTSFINTPQPVHTLQAVKVPNPQRWSVDSPVMYTAVTDVICPKGCLFDSYRTPIGIRDFKFDPNSGFSLNGENMKLKGVCLHGDAGGLGVAVPQQVWERRLRILKEAGVNAIRCSHNPPSPEFLDLCDKLGFVVMDEAFDEWGDDQGGGGKKKWIDSWSGTKFSTDGYHSDFAKWADTDLRDMVLRDRNHPSIIMWSIGNEIDYENDPYPHNSEVLAAIAPRLIDDVHALDKTRPVTAACSFVRYNTWYPKLDIIGYNYQESYYDADHARMPDRVIFGSENDMKSLDAWLAVKDKPFISAQFLWTGIDYNGEAGRPAPNKAWPERSRPDGFLDLAGFKKPAFYYRQSLWTDTPMIRIDANMPKELADKTLAVPPGLACYTNCDSVVVYQNGKSLGQSQVPPNHTVAISGEGSPFNADPAQGPIRAVGMMKGVPLVEDTFRQSGPATHMMLTGYKSLFGPGDGPNVAQIELALLDLNGTVARDAANEITVKIDGPGKILAMESGDVNSHENYQDDHQKAFHGRLLLYLETHGTVYVTTRSPGLPEGRIRVGG